MDQDWSAPAWAVLTVLVVLVALGLVLLLAVRRGRARTDALVAASAAETQALRAQVEAVERRLSVLREPVVRDETEYKITLLGEPTVEPEAPVVPAPVFADLVLRESAVQAVSFAAGLRRALAPETRNRIRFAMRSEVKRARKQRRLDVRRARQAVREGTAA